MYKEAQILLATLIQLMAEKMEGWFNSRITAGLQSLLQDRNPGCFAELGCQVPCRPGSQTGGQVWDWVCRNKYLAPISFHSQLRKLTHSNPPLPL